MNWGRQIRQALSRAFEPKASDLSGDSPAGPEREERRELQAADERLLRRLVRDKLRRLGAATWWTKRHTRGVRANYADALSKLGPKSRAWAVRWWGAP